MSVDVTHPTTAEHDAAHLGATTHIHLARAHFWNLFGGQVANKILRFGAAVLLARFLTPSAFGLFNVGIAISGVLVTASALGLPELGSRAVAADARVGRTLLFGVTVLRTVAVAVGAALLGIGGIFVWPHHPAFYAATVCIALAMAVTPDWLARGLERMRTVGVATTAGGVVACLGAAAVWGTRSVAFALFAFAAAEATVGIVCWRGIAGTVRPLSFALRPAARLVRESWPLGVAGVITYSYYANVDSIVLAAFRGTHEAGVYSAAYRIFLTFNIVPIFAAYAAFPILSRLRETGGEGGAAALNSMVVQLTCYGALVVGFAELAGGRTLTLLFGTGFEGASSTFILLGVAAAWYAVGYGAGYTLIAFHRQRWFVTGSVIAGVLSIALDLLLIPFWGMVGAAVATVVAFATATVVWLYAQRLPRQLALGVFIALLAVTAGGSAAVALPVSRLPIGAATLCCAIAAAVRTSLVRRESPR